jgi:hypothetical protein
MRNQREQLWVTFVLQGEREEKKGQDEEQIGKEGVTIHYQHPVL